LEVATVLGELLTPVFCECAVGARVERRVACGDGGRLLLNALIARSMRVAVG